MKVKELIKRLRKLDGEKEVCLGIYSCPAKVEYITIEKVIKYHYDATELLPSYDDYGWERDLSTDDGVPTEVVVLSGDVSE